MINPLLPILENLQRSPDLTQLTAGRIWAGEAEPPTAAGYQPEMGGAVVFNGTGGLTGYAGEIISPRIQIKCYGRDKFQAYEINAVVTSILLYELVYPIRSAAAESGPIDLREPGTEWPFVLSFWRVNILNELVRN